MRMPLVASLRSLGVIVAEETTEEPSTFVQLGSAWQFGPHAVADERQIRQLFASVVMGKAMRIWYPQEMRLRLDNGSTAYQYIYYAKPSELL